MTYLTLRKISSWPATQHIMSDPIVSERRIRQIQDAVAVGNWRQALKECEKWQKKGERSDKFLVRAQNMYIPL
jgi:hypothetical protein